MIHNYNYSTSLSHFLSYHQQFEDQNALDTEQTSNSAIEDEGRCKSNSSATNKSFTIAAILGLQNVPADDHVHTNNHLHRHHQQHPSTHHHQNHHHHHHLQQFHQQAQQQLAELKHHQQLVSQQTASAAVNLSLNHHSHTNQGSGIAVGDSDLPGAGGLMPMRLPPVVVPMRNAVGATAAGPTAIVGGGALPFSVAQQSGGVNHRNAVRGLKHLTHQVATKKACKSKRVRTIFTPEQLERLEAEFERQQYMVGPERLYLAHTLQLTEAQVKVWFQNRRIKWRKHHLEITHQRLAVLKQQQQQLMIDETNGETQDSISSDTDT